jgi:hypothetical protein
LRTDLRLLLVNYLIILAQLHPWSDLVSFRLTAAALFAIFCVASPSGGAGAAPDADLALQGLLTGDKVINNALINEFQKGYGDGHVDQNKDTKKNLGSDKAKAKKGKFDRALDQAYQRGFNLGRQDKAAEDKAAEDEKASKP